jgi:hypothetical protein
MKQIVAIKTEKLLLQYAWNQSLIFLFLLEGSWLAEIKKPLPLMIGAGEKP